MGVNRHRSFPGGIVSFQWRHMWRFRCLFSIPNLHFHTLAWWSCRPGGLWKCQVQVLPPSGRAAPTACWNPPKCRWFGRSPAVPSLGVCYFQARQVQVTSSLDSLDHQYFYKEIACVQCLLSLNVFLHHEQTGPPAHVCLQIYIGKKNIGITMVAQVCVCADFVPLLFSRPSCLDVSKNGNIGSTARWRKKIVASQTAWWFSGWMS